jgi:hypothetical protein
MAQDKFEMNLRTNIGLDANEFENLLDSGRGFRSQNHNEGYKKRTRTLIDEQKIMSTSQPKPFEAR